MRLTVHKRCWGGSLSRYYILIGGNGCPDLSHHLCCPSCTQGGHKLTRKPHQGYIASNSIPPREDCTVSTVWPNCAQLMERWKGEQVVPRPSRQLLLVLMCKKCSVEHGIFRHRGGSNVPCCCLGKTSYGASLPGDLDYVGS